GVIRRGEEVAVLRGIAAARVDDLLSARGELLRDLHSLGEQPARIVPEVDDDAARMHPLQLVERGVHLLTAPLREVGETDVAHAVAEHAGVRNALDLDDVADDVEIHRLLAALAEDRQRDLAPALAAHLLHGVVEGESLGGDAVDLDDPVPSMGAITVTQRSRMPIEIPIPPKAPCVVVSRRSASSLSRYWE